MEIHNNVYINRKKEGIHKEWNTDDGNLRSITTYKNGNRNGIQKDFHIDESLFIQQFNKNNASFGQRTLFGNWALQKDNPNAKDIRLF